MGKTSETNHNDNQQLLHTIAEAREEVQEDVFGAKDKLQVERDLMKAYFSASKNIEEVPRESQLLASEDKSLERMMNKFGKL